MKTASTFTFLILGALACTPAIAQEASAWIGAHRHAQQRRSGRTRLSPSTRRHTVRGRLPDGQASWYNALAPGDEPPYPANGPAEFYQEMSKVVGRLRLQATVYLYVLVGADGKARNVRVIGMSDPDVRKVLARVAVMVKYKPAVCAGQPCEMVYPYHLGLGQK